MPIRWRPKVRHPHPCPFSVFLDSFQKLEVEDRSRYRSQIVQQLAILPLYTVWLDSAPFYPDFTEFPARTPTRPSPARCKPTRMGLRGPLPAAGSPCS